VGGTKQREGELILKLYELRRDDALRRAREWYAVEFNPRGAADIVSLMRSGLRESAHYRMVTTYWDMAAALVNYGSIAPELFHASNTEYLAIFAKIEPFIGEVRAQFGAPGYLRELERVARDAPGAAEYFEKIRLLMSRWAEAHAQKSAEVSRDEK
jgi:hypothetical protein